MGISSASPVKVTPVLDAKPWGGRRLETCGVTLPSGGSIGEALLTAPSSTVATGPAAGRSLGELADDEPEVWIGARGLEVTGGRPVFPLLIKLIDANADLSLQVHPDDAFAAAADLGTGKTEAWHILSAQPESVLYLGLSLDANNEDFSRACLLANGSAARFLRRVPASPGMTFVVPAGTLHAIGAGLLIYEIQQPSNVTFRLDDWGRLDDAGQPRELHHESGFAVLDATSRPEEVASIQLRSRSAIRELLAATGYFALEKITFARAGDVSLPALESPQALTCLAESVSVKTQGADLPIAAGETAIIAVGLPSTLSAPGPAIVLRGWVPDLARDVIAPCRAAGASMEAIHQLGVALTPR